MLQIDATSLVIFFIIWILVFVLSRVFWKPMIKVVNDRNAQIHGDQEAFQSNMKACERSLGEVDRTLKSAKKDAEKLREGIEVEALKEKVRLLAEAGAESKTEVEKAKSALQDEIFRLKKELESEAGSLADQIERRLLN